jgi:hypothetical protein
MRILLAATIGFALCAATGPAASSVAGRAPAARAASAEPRMVLPFIRDDYPRALALAKARKVPLFIESWAPW